MTSKAQAQAFLRKPSAPILVRSAATAIELSNPVVVDCEPPEVKQRNVRVAIMSHIAVQIEAHGKQPKCAIVLCDSGVKM